MDLKKSLMNVKLELTTSISSKTDFAASGSFIGSGSCSADETNEQAEIAADSGFLTSWAERAKTREVP